MKLDKSWQMLAKVAKIRFWKIESCLDANIFLNWTDSQQNQTRHLSAFQWQLWWRQLSHEDLEGEGHQETGPWSSFHLEFQTGILWIQPETEFGNPPAENFPIPSAKTCQRLGLFRIQSFPPFLAFSVPPEFLSWKTCFVKKAPFDQRLKHIYYEFVFGYPPFSEI